jgi:hypothetical protein
MIDDKDENGEKTKFTLDSLSNLETIEEVAQHTPVLKIGPAEHTDDVDGDDDDKDDDIDDGDVNILTPKNGP